MLPVQVGLVDKTGSVDLDTLTATAAALNIQVQRDLAKFWNVPASVRALSNPRKIPVGVWPVMIVDNLPPDEGGVHEDKHHQPFALVEISQERDAWTIAASHEIIEMLIDPYGNRMHSSRSIQIVGGVIEDGPHEFSYLVEGADPCEGDPYAYSIEGVAVSDFITPNFYDPVASSAMRYSFTGAIKKPREILPGGYISWVNPADNQWYQLQYFDPKAPPKIVSFGAATHSGENLRSWIDARSRPLRQKDRKAPTAITETRAERRAFLSMASEARAGLYRL
jgi:hypothetical protein